MEEIVYPESTDFSFLRLIEKNSSKIESNFNIIISLRGNKIMFDGNSKNTKRFKEYINQLQNVYKQKKRMTSHDIDFSLSMAENDKIKEIQEDIKQKNKLSVNNKQINPKTYNQKRFLNSIKKNDLTFAIGPAGTGKTFLAVGMALYYYLNKKVERIVLTRPVVEAGEKLGFLPGDIKQKINPYLRPLYDSLYYFIGIEKTNELIDNQTIEIAPLAYMRGRTINNAFIILDEGQNTLNSQMKMFLTRFGENSKVVVTADISQIDLENPKKSGIFKAIDILSEIKGIGIIYLTKKDVVRHPLVQKIINAYEKQEKE